VVGPPQHPAMGGGGGQYALVHTSDVGYSARGGYPGGLIPYGNSLIGSDLSRQLESARAQFSTHGGAPWPMPNLSLFGPASAMHPTPAPMPAGFPLLYSQYGSELPMARAAPTPYGPMQQLQWENEDLAHRLAIKDLVTEGKRLRLALHDGQSTSQAIPLRDANYQGSSQAGMPTTAAQTARPPDVSGTSAHANNNNNNNHQSGSYGGGNGGGSGPPQTTTAEPRVMQFTQHELEQLLRSTAYAAARAAPPTGTDTSTRPQSSQRGRESEVLTLADVQAIAGERDPVSTLSDSFFKRGIVAFFLANVSRNWSERELLKETRRDLAKWIFEHYRKLADPPPTQRAPLSIVHRSTAPAASAALPTRTVPPTSSRSTSSIIADSREDRGSSGGIGPMAPRSAPAPVPPRPVTATTTTTTTGQRTGTPRIDSSVTTGIFTAPGISRSTTTTTTSAPTAAGVPVVIVPATSDSIPGLGPGIAEIRSSTLTALGGSGDHKSPSPSAKASAARAARKREKEAVANAAMAFSAASAPALRTSAATAAASATKQVKKSPKAGKTVAAPAPGKKKKAPGPQRQSTTTLPAQDETEDEPPRLADTDALLMSALAATDPLPRTRAPVPRRSSRSSPMGGSQEVQESQVSRHDDNHDDNHDEEQEGDQDGDQVDHDGDEDGEQEDAT
jgi:hypothetical protein